MHFPIGVAGGGAGGADAPHKFWWGGSAPPRFDPWVQILPSNVAILERFCMKKSKISSRLAARTYFTSKNSLLASAAVQNQLFEYFLFVLPVHAAVPRSVCTWNVICWLASDMSIER